VAVTVSIKPALDDFPSILLISHANDLGVLALRGRQILGDRGNVYYAPVASADPSLTGISKPGDAATRPNYLNALWSSNGSDGASGDTVEGKIFACKLLPTIPIAAVGTNLGTIATSQTIYGSGGKVPTSYKVDKINLANNDTLTVDTTGGPVEIIISDKGNPGSSADLAITLRNTAKILNIRTDGQPPKVGDFRIMVPGNSQTNLYDKTCIQDAFLYSIQDELRILTSGAGCPSGGNTNFEGVVWAEAILSSKNAVGNRAVNYPWSGNSEYDSTVTPAVTSGIDVPDDLSSLSDLLKDVDWPVRYRYEIIQNWQRVN
jgi:hypothetical protein